jgi:hypothetical protein
VKSDIEEAVKVNPIAGQRYDERGLAMVNL